MDTVGVAGRGSHHWQLLPLKGAPQPLRPSSISGTKALWTFKSKALGWRPEWAAAEMATGLVAGLPVTGSCPYPSVSGDSSWGLAAPLWSSQLTLLLPCLVAPASDLNSRSSLSSGKRVLWSRLLFLPSCVPNTERNETDTHATFILLEN